METVLGNTTLLDNTLFFLFFYCFGDKTGPIYFADWSSNKAIIN